MCRYFIIIIIIIIINLLAQIHDKVTRTTKQIVIKHQFTAKSNVKLSKYATPIFIGVYKQLFYFVNI